MDHNRADLFTSVFSNIRFTEDLLQYFYVNTGSSPVNMYVLFWGEKYLFFISFICLLYLLTLLLNKFVLLYLCWNIFDGWSIRKRRAGQGRHLHINVDVIHSLSSHVKHYGILHFCISHVPDFIILAGIAVVVLRKNKITIFHFYFNKLLQHLFEIFLRSFLFSQD